MHPIPLTLQPLTSHLSCRQRAGEEEAQPCFRSHNTVIKGNNHLGQPCKDTCTEALGFLPTGYHLQYQGGDTQKGWADRLLKAAPWLSAEGSRTMNVSPGISPHISPSPAFPPTSCAVGTLIRCWGGMQNGPTTLGDSWAVSYKNSTSSYHVI